MGKRSERSRQHGRRRGGGREVSEKMTRTEVAHSDRMVGETLAQIKLGSRTSPVTKWLYLRGGKSKTSALARTGSASTDKQPANDLERQRSCKTKNVKKTSALRDRIETGARRVGVCRPRATNVGHYGRRAVEPS